jgi:hypothetical protein
MEDKSRHFPGGTIDVFFNFGGGYCQGYRQHPQGGSHRRLVKIGTYRQYFLATPTRGHHGKHYYKLDRFHKKIFLGRCGAKDPGNITAKKFQSSKCNTLSFI